MTSSPVLSYSLGADDISKIVDALLLPLAPFFTGLTKEQEYVVLHNLVLDLSKGKTYTNKDDLDTLVKDIVQQIVDAFIYVYTNPTDDLTATPSALSSTQKIVIGVLGGVTVLAVGGVALDALLRPAAAKEIEAYAYQIIKYGSGGGGF